MYDDIEKIIQEFEQYTHDSEKALRNMLEFISEGRVPAKDSVDELGILIDGLRKKYLSIYEWAYEQLPRDEMPKENMPIRDYIDAIANSKAVQYKKLINAVKGTLETFASVKSLSDIFSAALAPYQENAFDLMKRLNSQVQFETDYIMNEITGPEIFLKALSCDEFDSEEGINLLEQVVKYFSNRVQIGVSIHKYFINTEKYAELETKQIDARSLHNNSGNDVNMSSCINEEKGGVPEKRVIITNSPEEAKSDSSVFVVSDTVSDEEKNQTESNAEKLTDSTFVKSLTAYSALLDVSENIGSFTADIHPAEKKKITSSVFISDMRKGIEKAEKAIIKEVDARNYTVGNILSVAKGMSQDLADSTLDYLYRKGYLRKYTLSPGGVFFCASPKLMKAMNFKECSKFIGIRQRAIEDWGETIEDKATSVAARIAYVNLYRLMVEHFADRKESSYSEGMAFFTDAFFTKVKKTDFPEDCEIAIGAFWDDTKECDDFLKTARNNLSLCGEIARLFIAGISRIKAQALAKAIFAELEYDFSETRIYLYSLPDNSYCRYPSMISIDEKLIYSDLDGTAGQVSSGEEYEGDTDKHESSESEQESIVTDQSFSGGEKTELEQSVSESKQNSELIEIESTAGHQAETESVTVDVGILYHLLTEEKYYAATAYVKSLVLENKSRELLYSQLAYALNDPLNHCIYSTENMFNLVSERDIFEEALTVSMAIRMFFSSQVRYDYNIKPFYDGIKNYGILNRFPLLSKVVYSLMDFKDTYGKGIDAYAGYRAKSQAELEKEIARLKNEANSFYDNFIIGRKKEKASQKRFLETKRLIFSASSDMGQYIKSIIDGDMELYPLMVDFLQENFFRECDEISEATIDNEKLWRYIVVFWEKAGDNMMYRRHADLMSHLRSNITNTTLKAVQLMVRWCVLVEQINNHIEDEGLSAYKRCRKPLADNFLAAVEEMGGELSDSFLSAEEKAGLHIVVHTLQEMLSYINGTINEHERKYYYAPFLLTDDIMLDENFLPDLDVRSSEMQIMQPVNRILNHVYKLNELKMTYRKRLTEILEEQGDDYGAARLIVEYLKDNDMLESEGMYAQLVDMIDSGESYAKETADLRKADFTGELELAQSYGQIDNSAEDKKEKILQIIDEWYEWSVNSANYGFLKKVMDGYLTEIRETAKNREADLLEQLKAFKRTSISGLTNETREKRIVRIEAMIKEQNYTVAEDLLARATRTEDDHEDVIEEDFLKEFLDNYDDYYQPVATHKSNFASLVSSRTRNKEERGAKRLVDNWLPGGSRLGKEHLGILLTCLGFRVQNVKTQNEIGKFENFIVQTTAQTGEKNNYMHPIAAFGSGAIQEGFRVVCINGVYDADGLIDVMKQIGNAKHTLILHDHALSKGERRRLARKTKNSLGDKFFGVVDRTVMMFLVRNFDETKINRMLISLIMPFGYYQPYVWESVNVMPPEIFMGRKYELERIKSATGANIVYGGRQLGKSALLKKAKEDIDWDENNNRAVYIEIKGLNYQETARKIGHELYDQGILERDIDTTNWDELARSVKKRLQSYNKRIPYLLLLLDEADAFIESCETVNYKPFDSLKDIQGIGVGRFKFVIAGLRNIVRFKREAALSNNSVLTHLETMTVKPFNISEARELLEVPLHYLGLRFPREKEALITLILATTNYFPGLIQLYCAKLLESMRKNDYAGYNEVDSPIYEVSEKHIKKVLADPEFMQQIREKYFITLKLDEDNYYYLIALIMAYLYQVNGYSKGYGAEDIQNAGIELGIPRIAELDIIKLSAFMEELQELNVLRNTDEKSYLFARFTFFQMMGTSTEVADKLMDYMEG